MRKIGKTRLSNPIQPAPARDVAAPAIDMRNSPPRRIAGATISGWSSTLDIDLDKLLSRRPTGPSIVGGAAPDARGVPDAPDARGGPNAPDARGVPDAPDARGGPDAPEVRFHNPASATEPGHMPLAACLASETVSLSDGTHITFATTDQFESVNTL